MLHVLDLLLSTMAVCFRKALNTRLTACRLSLRETLRLIQWCHFASPTQLTYTHKNEYANRHVYSQMLLHSNEHTLHQHHLRTILYESFQLHPTFWQEAPLFFFYCLLYHQRTRFHFSFFFSVQNRNITGLSACPPPHTCAHKRHTHTQRHTDPHSPWTCLLLFPCQQQKKQKKRLKREMKGVLKGGNWKRRDMHSCVFERQSSLSKREKGGPIKEVTRL